MVSGFQPSALNLQPSTNKFIIMEYNEFRQAGHYLIDYISDYLQKVPGKPLFTDVAPSFLNDLFEESIPNHPQSLESIQKILEEKLIPYCTHVNHPGYMGLITPSRNFR
jgi:hypothetical protein